MLWVIFGLAVLVMVMCLWAKGHLLGAVLMIPIAAWVFWLAFLPREPSGFQWFLCLGFAIMAAAFPIWTRAPAKHPVYPPLWRDL
jgi:hypothetical protein